MTKSSLAAGRTRHLLGNTSTCSEGAFQHMTNSSSAAADVNLHVWTFSFETWWRSLELEGLQAIGVSSFGGAVQIKNGFSSILLSWFSDMSKSTFLVSLDNRETSSNVKHVSSSTLHDQDRESGWCPGSFGIFCSCSLSLFLIFLSLVLAPFSILSFLLLAHFLKVEVYF